MAVRILIVDDHEVVREGLRASLAKDPRLDIVGTAGTATEALALARRQPPHIALVDLRLPDMTGEELTRAIRARFPSTHVIIVTTYLSEETVRACLSAGASDYVTKAAGLPELRAAIDRAMRDDGPTGLGAGAQIVKQLHELVAKRMEDAMPTPQQERVLELSARGLTNREIGERLYISESTVRFHLQKLKVKFQARTKTELVAKAIRTGVIAPAGEARVPPGER